MDPDEFRVLVVCTGNINRSALAAALLRTWVDRYLPTDAAARVVVTSAGLAAPVGRPMRSRTRAITERLGADGRAHRATQVDERVIGGADLVLTADVAHRDGVLGMVPSMLRSTFTIREAGGIAAGLGPAPAPASVDELRSRVAAFGRRRAFGVDDDGDITDPQGRDDDAYRAMAREEVPPLASIAATLFGMPPADVHSLRATVEDPDAFSFEGLGRSDASGSGGASATSRGGRVRRWFGRRDT
ncbi:low molecular weight phosphatase family protein [Agromyces luteolus]|uniref:Phosphotyrosine protein phosphatase I domain-containing protein n=1 Tax=Agromyces luteolus TaxID=88373 RepID=A0A7C9HJ49_9MICO|nr:hypothetical protein [Agromyces luteolus]MUN06402.1 hypothetical protein [Agromyces luteolus]GLK26564.1 low molecular weight phosphatase family protein [Agromyces luteolus]